MQQDEQASKQEKDNKGDHPLLPKNTHKEKKGKKEFKNVMKEKQKKKKKEKQTTEKQDI